MNNDLKSAQAIFEKTDSPRAKWGKSLIEIFNSYLQNYPTYFGIRNFLEIDLEFLIKNKKSDYIAQILGADKILANINHETYKYLARVFMCNNLYEIAGKYLKLAKDTLYNDPELHYICTNYYIYYKDYNEAYKHIKECLRILPDYYPAKALSEKITDLKVNGL